MTRTARIIPAILGLVSTSAFGQNIGTVTFDIRANGKNTITIPQGTMSLPIELRVSATSSGPDGSNNGIQSVGMNISGNAIAGVAQSSATPFPNFVNSLAIGGLGFNLFPAFAGGTGGVGSIAGIGDAQAVPGSYDPLDDAPNAGHAVNFLVATGILNLPLLPDGTYQVDLTGSANLWEPGFGGTRPAALISDTLTVIIPEPNSLLLVACILPTLLIRKRSSGSNRFSS